MNLWQKVQSLSPASQAQIINLYKDADIPIDIRHFLAPWVEVQVRELAPLQFLHGLQQKIDALPFFVRERLATFQNALRIQYHSNPEAIQYKILECLIKEHDIIKKEENLQLTSLNVIPSQVTACPLLNQPQMDPKRRILLLKNKSDEIDQMLSHLDDYQKDFLMKVDKSQQIKGILKYRETQNGPTELDQSPETQGILRKSEDINAQIKNTAQWIYSLYTQLGVNLTNIVDELSYLQKDYLKKEIDQWRFEQQRSFVGYPVTLDTSVIQTLAEDIAVILYKTWQQLLRANDIKSSLTILTYEEKAEIFQTLLQRASSLLNELVQITFLIENHPLPIIRTDTKLFGKKSLTVGSLVADKLRIDPPTVKIEMINAKAAENIFHNGLTESVGNEVIGELRENICKMNNSNPEHQERPHLASVFRHIRLKSLNESRRRGNTSSKLVTDEKVYLLCFSRFMFGNMEIPVWTLSFPFLVTTHVNQDCRATITWLWDYGLTSIDRPPFIDQKNCSWANILELLNVYFYNAVGVSLTELQKQCLTLKATKSTGKLIDTLEELKEDIEGRKFSFWDWFYSCTKLVEKHFKQAWCAGYIFGFVAKEKAEELLTGCEPWTFMLRFSDSIPGTISIVCRMDSGETCSLRPFDSKDLERRSLCDKINDLVQLVYIYPNIPKARVFGDLDSESKATSQDPKNSNGYKNIITVIFGMPWKATFERSAPQLPEIHDMDIDEILNNLDTPQINELQYQLQLDTLELSPQSNHENINEKDF